jgi:1,3-beta-galactosyl-N-acetylhexosamine phosphorylase
MLATNTFGKGRSVYFAGLPYSLENARLLLRALFWSAGRETEMTRWFSTNLNTDCAYWPNTKKFAVTNNTAKPQTTRVHTDGKAARTVTLAPYQIKWFDTGSKK